MKKRNTTPPPTIDTQPDIMPHWLTPRQVAASLQVSLRFVQQLIHKGELPASSLGDGGRIQRVDTGELRCYMAKHRPPAHIS